MEQTKTIRNRLLAIILSLSIVFSLVGANVFSASAAGGDVWATWTTPGAGATVTKAYIDFASSQGKTAEGYDWRGDGGAKNVLTANDIGTLNQIIWGCEAPCLDTSKDFTIKFTVKLEESDDSKVVNGDCPYINIDPRIAGGSISLAADWIRLDDLRAKTDDSSDGVVELYRVITKENLAALYNAGTYYTTLEIRLQGPSADSKVENKIASNFANVERHQLTVQSIQLYEGNIAPGVRDDGWNSDGKYYEGGQVVTDRIVESKDGLAKSYINSDGTLAKNSWVTYETADYYFDTNGNAVRGLQTIGDATYYFDSDYKLYKNKAGIIQIGIKKYAVKADGTITKNTWASDYYFGANGAAVRGLEIIDGTTYYFGDDYKLYKKVGVIIIDGASYYVSATGELTKTPAVANYSYQLLADGTVEITGYNGTKKEITIPSTLDGKAVTSIGNNAFEDCDSLTSVVIPDSVKKIGEYAFGACDPLKGIIIPDSVESISRYAFCGCSSLKTVTIGNSVKSIGDAAFYDCGSLTTVNFIGTKEEWSLVLPRIGISNERLTGAQINFVCLHTNTDTDKAVAPTCDKTGLTEGSHCKECGEVTVEQKVVPTLAHTEAIHKAIAATCEKTGLTEGKYCSVCNTVIKAQTVVKAKGHSITTKNIKSATYFAEGYTGDIACKVCNKTITKGKAIAKKVLKTPKVKVTAGKKQFKVKYTKVSGATGFQVQYKKGKKTVTKNFSTKKSATKTIKKLAKGRYKVKVRAFVKSGTKKAYSVWTKTKTLNIK